MKTEKLLEFGSEGGSITIYKEQDTDNGKIRMEGTHIETACFDSFSQAITNYSEKHDGLLHYYPIHIDPDVVSAVKRQLQVELSGERVNNEINIQRWKELTGLDTTSEDSEYIIDKPEQQFEIRPLEEVEKHEYTQIGDDWKVEQTIKTVRDQPSRKQIVRGQGEVKGEVFLIRDQANRIIGVYPLNQYLVKALPES